MRENLKKGRPLTADQRAKLRAELARRYEEGTSIHSLSAATGWSYGFIVRILSEAGAYPRNRRGAVGRKRAQQSEERTKLRAELVRRYEAGESIKSLAATTKRSRFFIIQLLKEAGTYPRTGGRMARRKIRLNPGDRTRLQTELVRRYQAGESIRSLAAATGRSYGFIHRILTEAGVNLRGRGGARGTRQEEIYSEVPVQIFIEETYLGPQVESSLISILCSVGADGWRGADPTIGSWYRKLCFWIGEASETEPGSEVRRGIELHLLDRFQAGIDGTTGDAVAKLITSLNESKGAVIQVGSILLVKYQDTILVRQLTVREMSHWHENPGLFKDPQNALSELQKLADKHSEGQQETPQSLPETG